ncbi:TolC family protein [Maridesulfovibrio hydrothermalis]|uniref:Outer membrane efflux protein n=1 Tax=Maridesulfovibrio hydrothermalis AM13 = DSM 14728 TaxID=1121451 RepID=L0RF09_9BACT|nr:TolC family protein [Maridesulfovibrio hydrothermalis]CCO24141.1 Outer membrane efflux protein [Maridesulfovibrio hydrothermalis AM13 = DSM 14728]
MNSLVEAKADAVVPPENLSDISFKDEGYSSAENIDSFKPGFISVGTATANNTSLQKSSVNNNSGEVLSIYQACRLAIAKHPLVASSYSSKLEKEADYGIAKSVYYPRIDFQTQLGPSRDLASDTETYGEGSISVTQTLYDFGGLQDTVASARLKAESANLRLARTNEDIAALTINSYLTILQAQELLNVYNSALDFYNKLLATFWERYNAGISSKADAQKVEVSLRSTQSQLAVQTQQLKTAKLLLENIIKQPVYDVETDVNILKMDIDRTLEESFSIALENNVGLKAYDRDIQSQQRVVSTKDSEYYPSLGYRLQAKNEYQRDNGEKFSLDAQLTLNWNLFNGFATDERIKKEEAVLKRMVATREATELEVQNVLSDAFNAHESSKKEFELAKEAYDSSVYLMSLYLSEFDLGIRTLLDLITAREGQTSAATREVNARFARIRAALNIYLEEGRLAEVIGLPLDKDPFQ